SAVTVRSSSPNGSRLFFLRRGNEAFGRVRVSVFGGTVFFGVLGHNRIRHEDAIGAELPLDDRAFAVAAKIRRDAVGIGGDVRVAVSQLEAVGETVGVPV